MGRMTARMREDMVKLDYIPRGYDEIIEYYGDPSREDFVRENTAIFEAPFPLRLSWRTDQTVTRFRAHKLVGPAIKDALFDIANYKGVKYLISNQLDRYGGVYSTRNKRGIDEPSTHSWAIAIDINPHRGELGREPTMPDFIVCAFERRGFEWGGRWRRPDGMHFQAARDY